MHYCHFLFCQLVYRIQRLLFDDRSHVISVRMRYEVLVDSKFNFSDVQGLRTVFLLSVQPLKHFNQIKSTGFPILFIPIVFHIKPVKDYTSSTGCVFELVRKWSWKTFSLNTTYIVDLRLYYFIMSRFPIFTYPKIFTQ